MRTAALAIATCLGVGYVPFAPGTFGSAAGLLLWAVVPTSAVGQGIAILASFAVGSWASNAAEQHFKATDPGPVVVDEVMGMLVTLFLVPAERWVTPGLGFVWFRLFDVIKPYPANRLERLPGGVGVMADDFMAAIYANLALRATLASWDLLIG